MYWSEDVDAVSVMPAIAPARTTERQFFTAGDPRMGRNATVWGEDIANIIMCELLNLVEGAGLKPEKNNLFQVLEAVKQIAGSSVDTRGRAYPGKIELLADPYDELPTGYYACYGARYALSTPQGQALQSLSPRLRSILGITVTAAGINVPQMKGYFLRAVDGITRLPGSIEQDAARPVTASARSSASGGGTVSFTGKFSAYKAGNGTDQPASGVFSETRLWAGGYDGGSGPIAIYNIGMNASASVSAPTVSTTITINQANQADENRPINMGMTPAIYLAV